MLQEEAENALDQLIQHGCIIENSDKTMSISIKFADIRFAKSLTLLDAQYDEKNIKSEAEALELAKEINRQASILAIMEMMGGTAMQKEVLNMAEVIESIDTTIDRKYGYE